MKCKRHPYDLGVGVCASCLRERLLALIAAQNSLSPDDHRRSNPLPPPLLFPRSVSPYVSHRRSVDSGVSRLHRHHLRFYSTPQVGPDAAAAAGGGGVSRGKKVRSRFSLLSSLFGHSRSDKDEADPPVSRASGSGSWFSALIPGRRQKSRHCSEAVEPARRRRSCRESDRGMSPAMEEEDDDSVSESGYSTESSASGWRRAAPTPMRSSTAATAAGNHRNHRHVAARGVSGFAVCLSPLVRASPNRRRGQASEAGFSGDLRSTLNQQNHRHVAGGGVSIGPNRSRKLADFGRFQ